MQKQQLKKQSEIGTPYRSNKWSLTIPILFLLCKTTFFLPLCKRKLE